MKDILSNKEIVNKKTSNIKSSLQLLKEKQNITYANRTTISGNTQAKITISIEKAVIQSFMKSLVRDLQYLENIANEFEQIDQIIDRQFARQINIKGPHQHGPRFI